MINHIGLETFQFKSSNMAVMLLVKLKFDVTNLTTILCTALTFSMLHSIYMELTLLQSTLIWA